MADGRQRGNRCRATRRGGRGGGRTAYVACPKVCPSPADRARREREMRPDCGQTVSPRGPSLVLQHAFSDPSWRSVFRKVLVANRGEIAVRAFRAATELGAQDGRRLPPRGPQVRAPAQGRRVLPDRRGGPPGPRLPRPREHRARRPSSAAPTRSTPATASSPRTRCSPRRATPRHHLHRAPGRGAAPHRQQGHAPSPPRATAGLPTLRGSEPGTDLDTLEAAADGHRLPGASSRPSPAAAGGACAASTTPRRLREALEAAQREADAAFGDPTLYLEEAVVNPRHIEVQVLADTHRRGRAAPLRARLLGPAPPPEGRRDRAGAQPRPGDPRADVRRRRALRARRSATSTPAPSSSSSARTGATSSSR